MLFSSSEVAEYINANFEPVWESVRPVPLVTIDFGNGHEVRRTLQGNIATYVCSPAGLVYDVLPGIYNPVVYRRELDLCKALVKGVQDQPGDEQPNYLQMYHARQAVLLRDTALSEQLQSVSLNKSGFLGGGGGFKGGALGFAGIEGPTAQVIVGRPAPAMETPFKGPLAEHPVLALDAEVNERVRRRLVHEWLASEHMPRPQEVKYWLFREVLHADLMDPLLGLGEILNINYPFADEDELDRPQQ